MAYTPTTWVNGSGGGTPLSATNLNHLETGVDDVDARLVLVEAYGSGPGAPATTLPGSPVNLQKAILTDSTTAPTYAWLFQYSTTISDSNKWLFVGGSAKVVAVATRESTASTTYVDLSTAGPSFTIPRAGTYMYTVTFEVDCSQSGATAFAAVKLGSAATADTEAATTRWDSATANRRSSGAAQGQRTAAASDVWKVQYRTDDAGQTANIQKRVLSVLPVRVA